MDPNISQISHLWRQPETPAQIKFNATFTWPSTAICLGSELTVHPNWLCLTLTSINFGIDQQTYRCARLSITSYLFYFFLAHSAIMLLGLSRFPLHKSIMNDHCHVVCLITYLIEIQWTFSLLAHLYYALNNNDGRFTSDMIVWKC